MRKNTYKILNTKYLILPVLFLVAFLERTVFDLGPNFEFITTAMILASYYFGKRESFWLIFAVISLSDRFIGNSSIFIFTWTGFLLPTLFSKELISRLTNRLVADNSPSRRSQAQLRWSLRSGGRAGGQSPITKKIFELISITSIGISTNIFFYLWTNFGVWFLDSFNMYPNGMNGLLMSYINGLPFLRYQLISTLILLPATFVSISLATSVIKYTKTRISVAPTSN